jgi:hypothetical protein
MHAAKVVLLIGFGFVLAHVVEHLQFAYMMSKLLYEREIETAVARNHRGDKVVATTDLHGAPDRPAVTVIELKRHHAWFSTTLLRIVSYGLRVGLAWDGDNEANVQLDFDCRATHTPPIQRVGSIRVEYQFGYRGTLPDNRYTVVPAEDIPQEPCGYERRVFLRKDRVVLERIRSPAAP